MEKLKENKALTITLGITFVFILIILIIIRFYIYDKCAKEAQVLYDQIHELYYYGGDIEFNVDENNERIYIEENDSKYYQISNYDDSVKEFFTENKLKNVNEFLNIIEKDNSYYMKDIGRGISNYYETTIKSKKIRINKRVFIAESKFCKTENQVSYGDGCEGDNEYTIKKEFVLVKVNEEWKVGKYTSIFELSDEIK